MYVVLPVVTIPCQHTQGLSGSTGVSVAMVYAHKLGIKVLVTNGIEGVQRRAQDSECS